MPVPYPYNLVGVEVSPILAPEYSSTRPGYISLAEDSPYINQIAGKSQQELDGIISEIHREQGVTWSLSGNRENRKALYVDSPTISGEGRTVHLGVDLNVSAGTPVFAPLSGEVVVSEHEAGQGTFGAMVVMKVELGGSIFYMQFAHLDTASLPKLGTKIERGEQVGIVGEYDVNGNFFEHLHFQVLTQLGFEKGFQYKGLCRPEDMATINDFIPDPMALIR